MHEQHTKWLYDPQISQIMQYWILRQGSSCNNKLTPKKKICAYQKIYGDYWLGNLFGGDLNSWTPRKTTDIYTNNDISANIFIGFTLFKCRLIYKMVQLACIFPEIAVKYRHLIMNFAILARINATSIIYVYPLFGIYGFYGDAFSEIFNYMQMSLVSYQISYLVSVRISQSNYNARRLLLHLWRQNIFGTVLVGYIYWLSIPLPYLFKLAIFVSENASKIIPRLFDYGAVYLEIN